MCDYLCPRLKLLFIEAYHENGIRFKSIPKKIKSKYSLYPQSLYKRIPAHVEKTIDFIFIGGFNTDRRTEVNRQWILPFIKTFFTPNSYLQFTNKEMRQKYTPLGPFDYTMIRTGMVPKMLSGSQKSAYDANYFDMMARSRFCLCPGGDCLWSMRFLEAIMCKCIPIVKFPKESWRCKSESLIGYKYYLTSDANITYRQDWVEHNYSLFLKYHTLEGKRERNADDVVIYH